MFYAMRVPRVWGGGPSSEQKAAAAREAALAEKQGQIADRQDVRETKAYNEVAPFYTDRIKNGLPFASALMDYAGGTNAQAYAPARARLMKVLSADGDMLPSGSKISALTDFENGRAHDFDSSIVNTLLLNDNARTEAARGLTGQQQIANPLAWSSASGSSNNAIMQAPLQSPGLAGPILGAVGAVGGGLAANPKF